MTSVSSGSVSSGSQPRPPVPEQQRPALLRIVRSRLTLYGGALACILVVSALLSVWGDSHNGYQDTYYLAAVLSATKSWKAFFFASLDQHSFITVDKPPVAFWVQALSARVFGLNYASVLFPQAAAALASVGVLAHTVRLAFGKIAAVIAALVLALVPVMVVVAHTNHPDMVLVLCMVLAAWGVTAALQTGRTLPLLAAAAALGLGFNTKLLQALVAVPALAFAYLWAGRPAVRTRILQLLAATGVLAAVCAIWVVIVQLIPAGSRPYIGSTQDNSEIDQVIGYNGIGRILGVTKPPPPPPGAINVGTKPGLGRLLDPSVAGQISWLLPMAVILLVAGLWLTRRAARTDTARAGYLLWGGWLVLHFFVLSLAGGQWHAYYAIAMAPAIAALTGAGVVALVRHGTVSALYTLGISVAVTAAWSVVLLHRTPDYLPWLQWVIGVAAAASLAAIVLAAERRHADVRLLQAGSVLGLAALLAGPLAYGVTTVGSKYPLGLIQAGPLTPAVMPPGILSALSAVSKEQQGPDPRLIAYLVQHKGSSAYVAAATNAITAAQYIIATGEPVLAMGGYLGTDPPPSVPQLQQLVLTGQVRFVLLPNFAYYTGSVSGSGSGSSGSGGQQATSGTATGASNFADGYTKAQITALLDKYIGPVPAAREIWVLEKCKAVSASVYHGNQFGEQYLYDCAIS